METIDLKRQFFDSICTFEMAKKAEEAGMTCANTFFSYDEDGSIGDGGWLQEVTGMKMYPVITYPFALNMIDMGCDIEHQKLKLTKRDGKYFLQYKEDSFVSQNIVDVLLKAWIKYKKTE